MLRITTENSEYLLRTEATPAIKRLTKSPDALHPLKQEVWTPIKAFTFLAGQRPIIQINALDKVTLSPIQRITTEPEKEQS